MKRWIIILLFVSLVVTCPLNIYAKPEKSKNEPGRPYFVPGFQERNDARYIINRTAKVLYTAQRIAEEGHYYTGLARAIAHQRKARELYGKRSYREAIYHSLRARKIAFQVIEENMERLKREYFRDEKEERYGRSAPRDNDLDIRLEWSKIGKDNESINLQLDLDIRE